MLYLAPAKQSIRLYDMRAVFQRRVIRILKHAPTEKEAEIYGSTTRPHDQGGNNKVGVALPIRRGLFGVYILGSSYWSTQCQQLAASDHTA